MGTISNYLSLWSLQQHRDSTNAGQAIFSLRHAVSCRSNLQQGSICWLVERWSLNIYLKGVK